MQAEEAKDAGHTETVERKRAISRDFSEAIPYPARPPDGLKFSRSRLLMDAECLRNTLGAYSIRRTNRQYASSSTGYVDW